MNDQYKLEKISLWLIGLLFVVPFLIPIHYAPIGSFYGESSAFLIGTLALVALLKQSVWQKFQLPRISLFPLGLLVLIVIQSTLGMVTYSQVALMGVLYLFWAALLILLGAHLRETLGWESVATILASALVIGGVLNAIVTIFQFAHIESFISVQFFPNVVAGNLAQQNHFADYVALTIGSSLYLYSTGKLSRFVFWGLTLAFLVLLALSQSRSAWLYLMAIAALALIKQYLHSTKEGRHLVAVCVVLLPLFAFIQLFLHWLEFSVVHDRFAGAQELIDLPRLVIWRDSIRIFLEHPWIGAGFGGLAFQSFLQIGVHDAGEHNQIFGHSHNIVLHLLAEGGLVAALLFFMGIGLWVKAIKWVNLTEEHWWMFVLLSVLGIHSMLEYPLLYSFFLGIAAFLLGAGERVYLQIDLSRIGRPILAFGMCVGLYLIISTSIAYRNFEVCFGAELKTDVERRECAEVYNKTYRQALLTPYAEQIFAVNIELNDSELDEKLQLAERSMHFIPGKVLAFRYYKLLKMTGDVKTADRMRAAMQKAYPEEVE